jgi:hypothetical protein
MKDLGSSGLPTPNPNSTRPKLQNFNSVHVVHGMTLVGPSSVLLLYCGIAFRGFRRQNLCSPSPSMLNSLRNTFCYVDNRLR